MMDLGTGAALGAAIAALAGLFVSVWQGRTAINIALLEHRLPIYRAAFDFVVSAMTEGAARDEDLRKFNEGVSRAGLFFGKATQAYIKDLRTQGARLVYITEMRDEPSMLSEDEQKGLNAERNGISNWFAERYGEFLKGETPFKQGMGLVAPLAGFGGDGA